MQSNHRAVSKMVAVVAIIVIIAVAAVAIVYSLNSSTSSSTVTVTSTALSFPVYPSNLIDLAKAEGGPLTIYSIEDPTSFSLHVWPAFQQLFPWATVNFLGLDPGSLISRPIAEYKSGHVTADIDWWGPITCLPIDAAGAAVHQDLSSYEKQLGYANYQINDLMTPTSYVNNVIFYNTNLANDSNPKALPIPATYADLANPIYKGKFANANPNLLNDVADVYIYMYHQMNNNASWTNVMKGIAANEFVEPFSGAAYTDVSQGAYAIGLDTLNDVLNGIAAGLPVAVDWKMPTVTAVVNSQCIMKNAPHPNLALLFAEWEMSAASGAARISEGFLPTQPDAFKTAVSVVVPSTVSVDTKSDYDFNANYSYWVRAFTPIFGSPS